MFEFAGRFGTCTVQEHVSVKWIPVNRKNLRQNKRQKDGFGFVKTKSALAKKSRFVQRAWPIALLCVLGLSLGSPMALAAPAQNRDMSAAAILDDLARLPSDLLADVRLLTSADCARGLVFHSGIAMHGTPSLGEDFSHFPYANPDAPKGGALHLAFLGTFDSLNPFNTRALTTAQGINGNIYQTLLMRAGDEPFSLYGLIAAQVATDDARTRVAFRLNAAADFSDGAPLSARDVIFSFLVLRAHGRPQQRAAYSPIHTISVTGAHEVCFDLGGSSDRELPLTLGLMPVLPFHHLDVAGFDSPSLAIPLGSGPYVMSGVHAGEGFTLERRANYWGDAVPSQRGFKNFATIDVAYFRDANSLFEAFKAGLVDIFVESDPVRWQSGYDFPAIKEGRIKRGAFPLHTPLGMEGFVFNLRRPLFQDVRVREALASVFDFEWINAKLYQGLYARTTSFFADSALSAYGLPASARERALLAPFADAVRQDVMEGTFALPHSDGTGRDRALAQKALALLNGAGFAIRDGVLRNRESGEAFAFDIMVRDIREERLALVFAQSLERLGIAAKVRLYDDAQYLKRRETFDFDMMIAAFIASPSPGNEQRGRFSSASADSIGSYNVAGVKNPAVDALITALLAARDEETFVDCVRAYDRVLMSGFYLIPLFHAKERWIAWQARLTHPDQAPLSGVDIDTWWQNPP